VSASLDDDRLPRVFDSVPDVREVLSQMAVSRSCHWKSPVVIVQLYCTMMAHESQLNVSSVFIWWIITETPGNRSRA
jgi:hypothetical protein